MQTLDFIGSNADADDVLRYLPRIIFVGTHSFLSVAETLTRIGYRDDKTLTQTCHIIQRGGEYFITHFKHLYAIDRHRTTMTQNDIRRLNKITRMLVQWGLIELVNPECIEGTGNTSHGISVIKSTEVPEYKLIGKYTFKKESQWLNV